MFVIKRDGRKEAVKFDKVTARIQKLAYGLSEHVDTFAVAQKTIEGIYDGVTSTILDNLAAEVAASLTTKHPDYALLASRIAVSNLHKNTKKSFSATMKELYNYIDPKNGKKASLIADDVFHIIWNNRDLLDSSIIYDRDFAYDYFGFKTLEKSYLMKTNGKVAERPQHMIMRVAVGIHKEDIESTLSSWNEAIKNKSLFEVEHRIKMSDGSYRWHLSRGFPQLDNEQNLIRWYGTATDIHDQKAFSEKLKFEVTTRTGALEKSMKELESFNYVASHDLQEPLRKIRTFISLLIKDKDDPVLWTRYANKIQESAQRMSELINSLLNYSRISESGEAFVSTDLNKVLGDVLIDEELLIAEHEASVLCSGLPVIHAIPIQMHQLFSNLINNSIKFSARKPEIRIESELVTGDGLPFKQDDPNKLFAQIRFKDNGIGFDPQYKEQIFKLFQRLNSRTQYKGTGVGLSIVRKIVETHNGRIQADSAINEGSTFTIWLPVE